VPRTRRRCAHGPAPMGIRSAIAVESPVTSWKTSPPARRRRQLSNPESTVLRGAPSPGARPPPPGQRTAPPVRAVLGLPSVPVEASPARLLRPARQVDHRDRPPTERCSERGRGFRDDDVLPLHSALIVATPIGRSGASPTSTSGRARVDDRVARRMATSPRCRQPVH
jgi:hypothetical protein